MEWSVYPRALLKEDMSKRLQLTEALCRISGLTPCSSALCILVGCALKTGQHQRLRRQGRDLVLRVGDLIVEQHMTKNRIATILEIRIAPEIILARRKRLNLPRTVFHVCGRAICAAHRSALRMPGRDTFRRPTRAIIETPRRAGIFLKKQAGGRRHLYDLNGFTIRKITRPKANHGAVH